MSSPVNKQDSPSSQPLQGIRIVDMTWWAVGPASTRILAALGAEVIKVERPDSWEGFRHSGVTPPDFEPGPNSAGMFNHVNPDKLGTTLNVRHPKGFQLLRELISNSDLIIENFSYRVLESWGLNYDVIRKIRPDIIYVSITGFGRSGPCREYVSYGPTAQALSGLTFLAGDPNDAPAGWGFAYMDLAGGHFAAMAVLNALLFRNKTGKGQAIDLSVVESAMTLTGPFMLDYQINGRPARRPGIPTGSRALYPKVAPHNCYRCLGQDQLGQDEWCVIACHDETHWKGLCIAMNKAEWVNDPRFATNATRVQNEDLLDSLISRWTGKLSKFDVMYQLQEAGIPASAVQNGGDRVERDPQLHARGMFQETEHPVLGRRLVEAVPIKLSRTPCKLEKAAPLWGEHNAKVFGELLGQSNAQLGLLRDEGVI